MGASALYQCVYLPTVNDWDLYEKLLDHVLARHVKTESEYHPILMSEPPVSMTIL